MARTVARAREVVIVAVAVAIVAVAILVVVPAVAAVAAVAAVVATAMATRTVPVHTTATTTAATTTPRQILVGKPHVPPRTVPTSIYLRAMLDGMDTGICVHKRLVHLLLPCQHNLQE
jgi:hypothetical protein